MAIKKIDYEKFEKARTQQLDHRLQETLQARSNGKIDSLKRTILSYVSDGEYDVARSELNRYVQMQREYPAFIEKGERYINHCHDVIQTIKAKRDFPGMHTLPMSKQQEIMEKVLAHFEELKFYLHKLEVLQKDVKMDDLRSTVWVIKAIIYSLFFIIVIVFLRSAALGILESFDYVINEYTNEAINWLFDFF